MATQHVPSTPATRSARLVHHARTAPPRPRRSRRALFDQVGRPAAGGATWLWARADLDIATVARARRELSTLVAPGRNPGNVLVYLGPDRFVDLRGLRLLVDTARRVRARGGDLAVVAPPRCLRRLVQLVRLDAELRLVVNTRQAAWWARTRGTGLL
jgi:anti-anti-sigma factor